MVPLVSYAKELASPVAHAIHILTIALRPLVMLSARWVEPDGAPPGEPSVEKEEAQPPVDAETPSETPGQEPR